MELGTIEAGLTAELSGLRECLVGNILSAGGNRRGALELYSEAIKSYCDSPATDREGSWWLPYCLAHIFELFCPYTASNRDQFRYNIPREQDLF